jgi:hypothetical protein
MIEDNMPQISLKISKNIDIARINFQDVFIAIHDELAKVPDMNVKTCNSGVLQEVGIFRSTLA